MVLVMIELIVSYIIVLILIVTGTLGLVLSENVTDHYYYTDGELYSGDKFAIVLGLSGVAALFAALFVLIITSKYRNG